MQNSLRAPTTPSTRAAFLLWAYAQSAHAHGEGVFLSLGVMLLSAFAFLVFIPFRRLGLVRTFGAIAAYIAGVVLTMLTMYVLDPVLAYLLPAMPLSNELEYILFGLVPSVGGWVAAGISLRWLRNKEPET